MRDDTDRLFRSRGVRVEGAIYGAAWCVCPGALQAGEVARPEMRLYGDTGPAEARDLPAISDIF